MSAELLSQQEMLKLILDLQKEIVDLRKLIKEPKQKKEKKEKEPKEKKEKKEKEPKEKKEKKEKEPKIPKQIPLLKYGFNEDLNYYKQNKIYEIGVDEAGRGPLFGSIYAAAVILPFPDDPLCPTNFNYYLLKDSKKFTSKEKIREVAEYIRANSIAWSVQYIDEKIIDEINIRQANMRVMHNCINEVNKIVKDKWSDWKCELLIDGSDFIPLLDEQEGIEGIIPYNTVEKGDANYYSVAAASILAKVARDDYIEELCKENSFLGEKYGINTNMGYGAKNHLDGIKKYGITKWHRKTFGICKNYANGGVNGGNEDNYKNIEIIEDIEEEED